MHNIWVRLNAVIFFSLTVLLVMASMCAFSSILHKTEARVKVLKLNNLRSLRNHGGVDRALLSFDLHADLKSAFHWNSKQLFVFLVAEYNSTKNPLNQVIIWDKIIQSKQDSVLKVSNEFVKYALIDQGAELRGNTITLKLMWDHMPITGRLYTELNGNNTFVLPVKYKQ
mmetsp:Transcript_18778/g.18890  ORF Transcript_18778/g.18890 Transcript_18778/m.18890 type:complete len:170 (-) Transcript_18778:6-515(-)